MKTLLLLLAALALVILPLRLQPDAEYAGSDNRARDAIGELAPAYRPWAEPVWTPPGAEIESMLFAVQAAAGAGVLGFCLGRFTTRNGRSS